MLVSNYYGKYEAQNLCISLEKELNIKIIKVRGPFIASNAKKLVMTASVKVLIQEISGTKIRKALIDNLNIKDIFMRKKL